ncbi:MAG: AsmA family protein [Pseudomonadota bacterium]
MSRSLTITRHIACVFFALAIILPVIAVLVLHSAAFKQRLERNSSASFALDLTIGQPLQVSLLHGLRLSARDLHMRKQGLDVASASQVHMGIDLLPLLRGEVRINNIALHDPVVAIERYHDGSFNFTRPQPRVTTLQLLRVEVHNANVHFTDMLTDTEYSATGCDVTVLGVQPIDRPSLRDPASLTVSGDVTCATLSTDLLIARDLELALSGNNGTFTFNPITMTLFGAEGSGSVLADLSGAVPRYEASYALPQFLLADFFALMSPTDAPTGMMDFSTHLTAQGHTLPELKQSLTGQLALQGHDLIIQGSDLDEQFARYESSQHFNLVDAGAVLFAGPLGLLVTKGFNFANIALAPGTRSEIRAVISQWRISNGVAYAEDVAMATNENLLALKGELDFPNASFRNMSFALLDESGCARIEQTIAGTFQQPAIARPSVLGSLAGPMLTLLRALKRDSNCPVFYACSLAVQP